MFGEEKRERNDDGDVGKYRDRIGMILQSRISRNVDSIRCVYLYTRISSTRQNRPAPDARQNF